MPIYASTLTLKIDGAEASAALLEDLVQVMVEESLHLPSLFTLVIRNDYLSTRTGEVPWAYDSLLTIGKSVEISFTSSITQDVDFEDVETGTVIKGEITGIEANFNAQSQAPIIVRGYDVSHRLHRGRYNRSFKNMKDSDIVKKILGEASIAEGTLETTTGPYGVDDAPGYVFQENQTNMEFIRERAARNGYEFFVQDGKGYFRKPTATDTLNLTWLKDITSFQVRVSSAEQVNSVEVRGWNYKTKRPIVSTKETQTSVNTSTSQGTGKAKSTAFRSRPTMIVVNQPISCQDEADVIAQSLYNELSGEFIEADAKAEGNPSIRPGKKVSLTGLGKYSGTYYITETRHIYQQRVYQTEFSVRGLRDGDLLTVIQPQNRLQPGQTLMIGIVTNNKDPKSWGRVRVKFPTLTEDHESDWARVVAIGAGPNRGFDCLPEINDEVLVGFEHGDIHRPFVIGGMWNGTDAPPETTTNSVMTAGGSEDGGQVRLRTFKTRAGHVLQFVDDDKGSSQKGVYLTTAGGHKVNINDSGKKVEILTAGGQSVTLNDQDSKITITGTGEIALSAPTKISLTVGGNSLVIQAASVTLQGPTGKVDIAAAGINIDATATATLKGTITTVKGDTSLSVSAPNIMLG